MCKWQTQREQWRQIDRNISHILAIKQRTVFIWTQHELYLRTWQIPPFVGSKAAFPSHLYLVSAVFQLLLFLGADSNCVHLEVDNTEQESKSEQKGSQFTATRTGSHLSTPIKEVLFQFNSGLFLWKPSSFLLIWPNVLRVSAQWPCCCGLAYFGADNNYLSQIGPARAERRVSPNSVWWLL